MNSEENKLDDITHEESEISLEEKMLKQLNQKLDEQQCLIDNKLNERLNLYDHIKTELGLSKIELNKTINDKFKSWDYFVGIIPGQPLYSGQFS